MAIIIRRARKNRLERRHDGSVELSINRLGNPKTRYSRGHCFAVRAVRRHRVVCVRNGEDPGNKWDAVADQAVRVAIAIDALVVVADDAGDFGVILDIRENPENRNQRAIYTSVVNFSGNAQQVQLELLFENQVIDARALTVKPGETSPQVFLATQN